MYEPTSPIKPIVMTQMPTYEYKAVAFVNDPPTEDELQNLLNPHGAEGWAVTCVFGRFFIMARPTNVGVISPEIPTPPFYYGR